jgi:hypothetical protein
MVVNGVNGVDGGARIRGGFNPRIQGNGVKD